MNNLEEAAYLLENGWCTGDIVKHDEESGGDKHCAVGALTAILDCIQYESDAYLYPKNERWEYVDDYSTYAEFNKSPEAKALAEEVMDTDWFHNSRNELKELYGRWFETGDYAAVVYSFNDDQESKEPVIEMFKYAAKRLDV